MIDDVITVPDDPAYDMTLRLHRTDGLLVGPSTGAIVHAISEYQDLPEGLVVGVSPDGSAKYTTYFTERLGTHGQPTL